MPAVTDPAAIRTVYAARDFIDAHPDQWDQNTFGRRTPDGRESGCLAWAVIKVTPGWTVVYQESPAWSRDRYVIRADHADGRTGWIGDVAAQLIGQDPDTSFDLFWAANTRTGLDRMIADTYGPRPADGNTP